MSEHGSHHNETHIRDCAGRGVSPTQATDVELVRVAMPHKTEQCF